MKFFRKDTETNWLIIGSRTTVKVTPMKKLISVKKKSLLISKTDFSSSAKMSNSTTLEP